jgi:signal transduction histidine kinase/ligand-binding sensor domain-containing protein/DNA-binding response OmpR family regulator
MIRIFLLFIAIVSSLTVSAFDYSVSRRISSADGLSNDFVTEVDIDGYGYIWIATEAGVSRISGNSCQMFHVTDWPPKDNFLTMMDNTRLLPGQEERNKWGLKITALRYYKLTDCMLIGTELGLVVYDCKHGSMKYVSFRDGLVPSSIEDIVLCKDNGVWLIFGNGKVQHLDCNKYTLKEIPLKQNINANCGIDNGNGQLIIGHNKRGISVIDIKSGISKHYTHNDNEPGSLPGDNVRKIMKDSAGRIWVGTDHGLALFNVKKGTFVKVLSHSDNYDCNVYDIHQMHNGMLWIANDMGGIKVLNPKQDYSKNVLYYNDTKVVLSSINARAIAQDEYGNIWIGNHSTGIDFISARKSDFSIFNKPSGLWDNNVIYSITPAKSGGLWIAGDTELALWQDGNVIKRYVSREKVRRRYSFPRCIMSDRTGCVWIGVDDKGVVLFNPSTETFKDIEIGYKDCDIHSFAEDKDGRIWIGSEFGVYSYKHGEGVRNEKLVNKLTGNAIVTSFLWLKDNVMFVSTHGLGAYVINLTTGACKSIRIKDGLPSDRVSSATADGKGGLWLATHEGLVHVADALTLKGLTVYNIDNGLADNHTTSVMTDKIGRVWVGTYSGVACLDSSTGRISNYNHKDTGHPCAFITRPSKCNDGYFYFCTASGMMRFNPMTFTGNQKASPAQIISCEAYSPVGNDDTRISPLLQGKNGFVTTSYKQNTLRFTFCVRNYAQENSVEYSYMMKGMDDKWYYIGDDNDVVFRGLRPGHYTFVLRAKLKSQDWENASITQMNIYIKPPFWQTWWAYILYALLFVTIVIISIRSYKRRLALRNSLDLEKRENLHRQQLNEERLHFFTNITHELRTPLTLILGPLEDLLSDSHLTQQSKRKVTMIHKNAERLKDLINGILEFRKTETQNRKLTVARGDIGAFVKEICLNYKELYNNPKVLFTYSIEQPLQKIYFDSEVVTTILYNFLSNAIKYTEQGTIQTKVWQDNNKILIAVQDTGYGISKEALPHIFDRYYQADGKHQASGTGIGLALVKALADLHNATLSVESSEGKGSTFTLAFETENTYPTALHKEDTIHDLNKEIKDINDNEQIEDDLIPTLLIVEDNSDIREYIADSFSEDFRILQAVNGEEGLQCAISNIPDIIVSDIMMPKMNGIDMTRILKEDIRTSHIPIILLTAKDTDDDKEEGYECGANSYLTKPFTAKLLGSRIHNLLNAQRRLAEQIREKYGNGIKPKNVESTDNAIGSDNNIKETLSKLDRDFLQRLDDVISNNLKSNDLDLPFVTSQMAMSHSTFYRKVKALTGMTAKEYIRKSRLHHCYEMLESGDYNVTEAAMLTGFNHMAHFREIFKNEFGILPSDVKKGDKV